MSFFKFLFAAAAAGLFSVAACADVPVDPPQPPEGGETGVQKPNEGGAEVIDKISSSKAEILMIIDQSGSMYSLTNDTIGGFNSMIQKFKDKKLTGRVSTIFFNDKITTIHDRQDLDSVKDITSKEYVPSGTTSLLDAVGVSVTKLSQYPDLQEAKDTQVIVVIITDGQENSSKEYSKANVKKVIEDRQNAGWHFVFLGANIDAASEASSMGIKRENAVKYQNSSAGVRANYEAVADFAEAAVAAPMGEAPSEDWKEKVVKDENQK